MPTQVHLNDIGTIFKLTLKDGVVIVDLSSATTKEIIFKKPDNTFVTQTARFLDGTGDGTDGIIEYVSISGDLNVVGNWVLQAHVVLTSPVGEWRSSHHSFRVRSNLE